MMIKNWANSKTKEQNVKIPQKNVKKEKKCHFRGKDYVQQQKQRNQTIKPSGELSCLVPTRRKTMTL